MSIDGTAVASPLRALVVLPRELEEPTRIERVVSSVTYLAPAALVIDLAAPAQTVERYASQLPGRNVRPYRAGASERGYDVAVYMPGVEPPRAIRGRSTLRTYRSTPWGQLVREGPIDEFDYPHLSTHAFNRLGPRTGQFRFFPFVFTELRTGLGPINEYGHRITVDLASLRERPSSHKVIAVFGGSSTWSIFCQPTEMFTAVLERLLDRDPSVRFTVLNFGLAAATVLYESVSYMVFCEAVRPDVVIAHDGFNDLVQGQITDPYLLNRLHLTYYDKLERWAQILHGSDAEPFTWPWSGGPTPTADHPRAILTAYLRRRRQFAEIVRAHGGVFVSGLQPCLASKRAPSTWEAGWPERHPDVARGPLGPIFANVPYLYQRLLGSDLSDGMLFANVHADFERCGAEATLFEDFVHTVPEGDRMIALFYEGFLRDHVLPGLGVPTGPAGR